VLTPYTRCISRLIRRDRAEIEANQPDFGPVTLEKLVVSQSYSSFLLQCYLDPTFTLAPRLTISTTGTRRARAIFQNGVCGKRSRQKVCHRAMVARSIPKRRESSRTRRGVGPCPIRFLSYPLRPLGMDAFAKRKRPRRDRMAGTGRRGRRSSSGVARRGPVGPCAGLPTGSIRVGADHLAIGLGPQRPPDLHRQRTLDELDMPVGHEHVGAAGMVAVGVGDI
jgi:hypothetical protein